MLACVSNVEWSESRQKAYFVSQTETGALLQIAQLSSKAVSISLALDLSSYLSSLDPETLELTLSASLLPDIAYVVASDSSQTMVICVYLPSNMVVYQSSYGDAIT